MYTKGYAQKTFSKQYDGSVVGQTEIPGVPGLKIAIDSVSFSTIPTSVVLILYSENTFVRMYQANHGPGSFYSGPIASSIAPSGEGVRVYIYQPRYGSTYVTVNYHYEQ